LKNIKEDIMGRIKEGKLKMHSKLYFITGSVLALFGLIVSVATSTFIFSLLSFYLRSRSPMAGFKIWVLLSSFPWWLLILALVGLVGGIVLIRRYDFVYKIDFKIAVVAMVLVIIASGWLIDLLGFNDLLARRGPMQDIMKQYFQDKNLRPADFR